MMKRNLILLIVPLFSAICLLAQIPNQKDTSGELDGKFWITQSLSEKNDLLRNYAKARIIGDNLPNATPELAHAMDRLVFPPNLTKYRVEIDSLYADTQNLRIPIMRACQYAEYKMKGATESELSEYIANLRKALK
jgi:hypothetical protein